MLIIHLASLVHGYVCPLTGAIDHLVSQTSHEYGPNYIIVVELNMIGM